MGFLDIIVRTCSTDVAHGTRGTKMTDRLPIWRVVLIWRMVQRGVLIWRVVRLKVDSNGIDHVLIPLVDPYTLSYPAPPLDSVQRNYQ